MRYLITGGAGFIGRHLISRLSREPGADIVVLDNLKRSAAPALSGIRFLQGDIRDGETVRSAMQGVDVVYHLAAQSNVMGAISDVQYSFSTNVVGTFHVLAAAKEQQVKKLVFTSSREVYGEVTQLPVPESTRLAPKNAYGASKVAGEEYCRVFANDGLPVTILRLANVYGPGDKDRVIPLFLDNAVAQQPLVLYGGKQILDFVWIGDVVEALARAAKLDTSVGPVNIGSGRGTTVEELAERILQLVPSPKGVLRLESRGPEVSAFVADTRKAIECGLIRRVEDPLGQLEGVLRAFRTAA
jgi:UDP-glucose 4-epimerase